MIVTRHKKLNQREGVVNYIILDDLNTEDRPSVEKVNAYWEMRTKVIPNNTINKT